LPRAISDAIAFAFDDVILVVAVEDDPSVRETGAVNSLTIKLRVSWLDGNLGDIGLFRLARVLGVDAPTIGDAVAVGIEDRWRQRADGFDLCSVRGDRTQDKLIGCVGFALGGQVRREGRWCAGATSVNLPDVRLRVNPLGTATATSPESGRSSLLRTRSFKGMGVAPNAPQSKGSTLTVSGGRIRTWLWNGARNPLGNVTVNGTALSPGEAERSAAN
jgi:hypothetical protein